MAIAEELAALRERTLAEIAAADTSAALEAVRVAVLGKSGTLTGYLRSMGQVPAEERASVGKAVNAARVEVEEALAARKAVLDAAELEAAMGAAAVDVTLPGRAQQVGTRHLINGIIDEVSDIFLGLGYKVVEGEEIETGRKKVGAMLGDYVEIGCNSVLNPGTVIGRDASVYPTSCVRGVVPERCIYKAKGNIAVKK